MASHLNGNINHYFKNKKYQIETGNLLSRACGVIQIISRNKNMTRIKHDPIFKKKKRKEKKNRSVVLDVWHAWCLSW